MRVKGRNEGEGRVGRIVSEREEWEGRSVEREGEVKY